jgi:hypothetical protein
MFAVPVKPSRAPAKVMSQYEQDTQYQHARKSKYAQAASQ